MNRRMLRNAVVALGVISASVAASLLATGILGGSDSNASAVARPSAVATTVASEKLPRPLGRRDRQLSAGLHVLDLVALDTAHTGPAHLPKIAITLPSGWGSYHGFALPGYDGLANVMGLSFWDVDRGLWDAVRVAVQGDGRPGDDGRRLGSGPGEAAVPQCHCSHECRSRGRSRQVPPPVGAKAHRLRPLRPGLLRELDRARLVERPLGARPGAGGPDLDLECPRTAPGGRR